VSSNLTLSATHSEAMDVIAQYVTLQRMAAECFAEAKAA